MGFEEVLKKYFPLFYILPRLTKYELHYNSEGGV